MDRVMQGWADGSYEGQAGMTDGLSVGWTDSATTLRGDRQIVVVGGWMDRLVARQTDVEKDGRLVQQTYRRLGGGVARWGCKATYLLLMVGGPIDWCRRGLGSVESRRCN